MKFIETPIKGCYEISLQKMPDHRGKLVKTLHEEAFKEQGLDKHFAEEYYSVSKKGVLRGLHFQLPPYANNKLVYCTDGQILDVLVDVRLGSPTYGQAISFDLSPDKANMMYIPKGVAHGFYTLSDRATIVCKITMIHHPEYDQGISWQSVDIWPTKDPILSEKDKGLPLLQDFVSPFQYQVAG